MRYLHLIAAFTAIVGVAPVGAAEWPANSRDEFVNGCVANAKTQHDEKAATAYCECSADRVGAEFSEAEMQELQNSTSITPAMQQRLVAASSGCLTMLNQ